MKSASNMMAKWYQSAISPWPNTLLKMCAMPTASDGAPPVRPSRVLLADRGGEAGDLLGRHGEAPAADRLGRRSRRVPPSVASGALIAK